MREERAAVLILAALVSLMAPGAAAQTLGYLGVYPDETMVVCEHTGGGDPISVAHVILTNSIPVRELTFTAPVPDCLGGPGAFVFELSPFPTEGNSQTGITIDLGGCVTDTPVTVLTIYYLGGPASSCCYWTVGSWPGPDAYSYEFVDCDGVTRLGASAVNSRIYTCCESYDVLSPYEPSPPDGATGVSTEVVLEWLLPDLRCGEWIDLATHPPYPGPRPSDNFDYFTSYQPPEPLEANTTYYWQVRLQCDLDTGTLSPVWTFTTGDGPVTTEATTWGRIKALYE